MQTAPIDAFLFSFFAVDTLVSYYLVKYINILHNICFVDIFVVKTLAQVIVKAIQESAVALFCTRISNCFLSQ